MEDDDGAADAAIAHQQIAAEPDRGQRLVGRQLADERREIVAIRRHVDALARSAAPPARVARERDVARQRAAQRGERPRLAHHHAPSARASAETTLPAASIGGIRPIEPAPIVTTTSPSRTSARSASGSSAGPSTNTGSTLPATRTARAQRASVGRDDRRFARGIDVGQHQHVRCRQHLHEVLEQVACARVAVRLECQHEPASGKLPRTAAIVAAISVGW